MGIADDGANSVTHEKRISLKFQPFTIVFRNISYYVDMPRVNY